MSIPDRRETTRMTYGVPFVDAREHYRRLKPEVDVALTDTLARGDLVARQQLRDFERHLADYVGVEFAVGVSSGYHALHLSMVAAGIGPGDEVITAGHTFLATVSAIVHAGATPVLVDVAEDFDMDPGAVDAAVTPRTRAIIPVHLNGRVCDMARIGAIADRHGLLVIEDAAQALGATFDGRMAGSFGAAGCFSFYPFKSLGCFGDGGAVTTSDPAMAKALTRLRYNGEDRETGEYHYHGYTALLDNIQAAVLDVKLRHFPRWVLHRRAMAERYHRLLADVDGIRPPMFTDPRRFDAFQNYVIRVERRDELRAHLREAGVETLVSWPKPMWRHAALALPDPGLPEVERLCREVLSLPLNAETTPEQVEVVADAIRSFR